MDASLAVKLQAVDTLVYRTCNAAVGLVGGGTQLTLRSNFPYLGIWQPVRAGQAAPFICLEPWQGIADYVDASGELAAKAGMLAIAPDAVWHGEWLLSLQEVCA